MKNLLDYATLYGEFSFSEVPFSDVDNLIFCEILYLDFTGIISEQQSRMTIREAGEKYFEKYPYYEKKRCILPMDRMIQLFHLVYQSKRFATIYVSNYVYQITKKMQFGALTFHLKDSLYVAFMGTDDSLIGWEEDCRLAYEFPIPAQSRAIEYLNQVISFRTRKVKVGGHSKGGNLAMTASMYASPRVKRRIEIIYNNDGPGFREEQLNTKEYKWMISKLKMFVPEESVVGMLMYHHEKFAVVRSTEKKTLQHDGVTWECFGTRFVPGTLTQRSKQIDQLITAWIEDYNDQERKKLISTFFTILKKSGIEKKSELDHLRITRVIKMIKELKHTNSEEQQFLIGAFRNLLKKGVTKEKELIKP